MSALTRVGAEDGTNSGRRRPLTREAFEPIWNAKRARVIAFLESFGKSFGPFTDTDFWVVDDDLDLYVIQVEINTVDLLQPQVIYGLRDMLDEDPEFAITVAVVPSDGIKWPRMGLTLERGLIIDGLKREFLPAPYCNLHYAGSRPD